MDFKDEINELENLNLVNEYKISMGNIPILFTAPHTMEQVREDGTVKKSEPYTKAIALYLNKYMNTYSMIKLQDTGLDSNRDNHDDFKNKLLSLVDEHNIKLVIDLHGSKRERDYDVEFGNYAKMHLPEDLEAMTKEDELEEMVEEQEETVEEEESKTR